MKRILIIVENLPVPPDRRVWQEARTLQRAGYQVSVICPKGKGFDKSREVLDGIHIFRHPMPFEAQGAKGYIIEYGIALFWQMLLAWRVFFGPGFDVIQACNPPDNIFMVALPFRLLGRKFVFDHHDINPELYEVKFGRRDFFYRLLLWLERRTYATADISIATNESYKRIAVERGGMDPENVFVVRSAPDLKKFVEHPPNKELKNGRSYVVGYIGVMGNQDGVDLLLHAASYIVNKRGVRDIQFLLIGGGTEFDDLVNLAHTLGIDEYVTFAGFLRGEKLLEALSTIDIGVGPDICNDYNDKCTMNKVMEYMALGKPIVQFDLTESRVSAGDAAVYARANDFEDMAEKILSLAPDEERRKQLGEAGKKRMVEVLQWKFEEVKLLQAYEKLFSKS